MDNLSEHNLSKYFDDFSREQTRIMNELKGSKEADEEKDLTQALAIVQTITNNILKLRKLKKKQLNKL
jgi:hypothetical protein|tara:strand:+ start:287 stop:490 length:204 start_codon:yes stop_codon:yes gene_type:complete